MIKPLVALSLAMFASLPFAASAKSKAELPLEEIRNFVDVYNNIRNQYVEEKDGKVLIEYAIKGMLNELDPHSIYLKKNELANFQDDAMGSYVGFGIRLDLVKGKLIVISPIANSPAEKAGLKPNDSIIKIDDTVVDKMSMKEIDELLDKDTVKFTILRHGEDKQFEVTKTTVILPSVNDKILEKEYGYIRVTQFALETAKEFKQSLEKLMKENIKGLVLDLRNNPGGLVESATAIADIFLDEGLIVSTKNQNTHTEEKIHATQETLAKELPLVVLVNEGSASASELLAGALQSHKRALVVGRRSFGKGSVQEVIALDNGDAIKLTIARYYTPSGESIQAKGIKPDIMLSQLTVADKKENPFIYGEADIFKHLNNEKDSDQSTEKDDEKIATDESVSKDGTSDGKTDDSNTDIGKVESDAEKDEEKKDKKDKNDESNNSKIDSSDSKDEATQLAKSDLQLFEALNVLKVLIFKQ